METRLTLHLSGPFAALDSRGAAVDNLPRRGQAILAYLASQPGCTAPRGVLTSLIWGDRGEEQARASLRQELSQLRKALPDGVIDASRSQVWLNPANIAIVEQAEAPFLDGFDLHAGDFDDWLRDARLNSALRRRDAAIGEGQSALRNGQPGDAMIRARTALRLDPSSETAMQLLLRAAAQVEDRAGTIAEFARFRDTLKRELDVEPASVTLELVEALRRPTARAADQLRHDASWQNMRPVLAVLPFGEIGADPGDMFAEGIVEEITATLSRAHEFHIIARQSTVALQAERLDHIAAGKRLGADYLLEGNVRRAGDRVRITAQLVEAASGRTIWSERYDDRIDDLFDLQDRIAEHVAIAVGPSLRSAEINRARRRSETDRSVYELVLTAYPHIWRHRREDNAQAIAILGQALDRDPTYPVALGMKAWCHAGQCAYLWTADPEADRAMANSLVARAIAETLEDSPTLVACAAAKSMISDDLALSEDLNERALWLDPNNAWGWTQAGWIANYKGDPDGALRSFERAERLSPLDPYRFMILFGKAGTMVAHGRYDEATALVTEGIRTTPGATWAYRMLAAIHTLAGNHDAAAQAARHLRAAYPGLTLSYLTACLPPTWRNLDPRWVDSMVAAGVEAD
ncbi:BTAD domain-containing putative transcriptional regulator [Tropicimonas sp. IMCC34043]|uniref:BTAD domain-containing putative transcriptional regulator n=1 Tax=Tropicimonas sp. IMCC34043 TaxID=2248760 RepID=UPI000E243447|nr:BTAD domain-containing putative transcriptional regulator [Tropicimonas sp. IMCC34043]